VEQGRLASIPTRRCGLTLSMNFERTVLVCAGVGRVFHSLLSTRQPNKAKSGNNELSVCISDILLPCTERKLGKGARQ
jgi:hypothetical protein